MLFYRAVLNLPTRVVRWVGDVVATYRRSTGGRWWALSSFSQAKLALAYLRTNTPLSQLAAGFGVGTATAWRYVRQVVGLLAGCGDSLDQILAASPKALILDGTVIACDRLADVSFYSGHKHQFGVNVQALTTLTGDLVWTSPGLPGSTHDLTAARRHGLLAALAHHRVLTLADKGYQGAGSAVITPTKGRHLSRSHRRTNRNNARIRCRGERGFAVLKTWRILRRYRGCPQQIGPLVTAIRILENTR